MLNPNDVQEGMTVRFTGEGGYEMQLEKAHEVLEPGEVYLVSEVFRDKWGTYIYLNGKPRKSFIINMFTDAGNESPTAAAPRPAGKVRKVRAPAAK